MYTTLYFYKQDGVVLSNPVYKKGTGIMSIKVTALTKIYDTQRAVDDISFEIKQGEIVGFLGPNGAGKSTTMKIITTYLPPTSGNAVVCGYDAQDKPMEVRRRIGYL